MTGCRTGGEVSSTGKVAPSSSSSPRKADPLVRPLRLTMPSCFENTRERGHPARCRRARNSIAGRMPALRFSWFPGARQQTGMSDCSEIACHSERSEESRPGLSGAVRPTQSKIPRFARNDISSFPGARQGTGMTDGSENIPSHSHTFPSAVPRRERGRGVEVRGHFGYFHDFWVRVNRRASSITLNSQWHMP